MDCLTRGKRHLQQPAGEEEEKVRKHLYIQVHSLYSLEGDFSLLYKIDPNESGFFKELEPISKWELLGCGSAICDSSLYMFGGWKGVKRYMIQSYMAHCLHLDSREPPTLFKCQPIHPKMKANRAYPKTLTIGEKIYIFGSDFLGLGGLPMKPMYRKSWAEVFNTKDYSFETLNSPPPDILFTMPCIGVSVVIEKEQGGGHQILLATHNFSDLFIYDVGSGKWEHKPTNTISPFPLYSVGSPVIGKYIFLYGNGRVCVFDRHKNQFLRNNLCLLDYAWGTESCDTEQRIIHGVIHHLGGWKFCLVFSNNYGYLVTYLFVVSFEICNPEDEDGELHFKAGSSIKVAEYVLEGRKFVNSSLWSSSSQIVHSRNLKPRMNNHIIGGLSHVDYGTTSKGGDIGGVDYLSDLSKLHRMKTALDIEIHKLKTEEGILDIQLNENPERRVVSGVLNDVIMDDVSKSDEEEISMLEGEIKAQKALLRDLTYKNKLMKDRLTKPMY